ncbi:MAG: hypothetical protein FWD66_05465 [Paludibacter sp.]|nr:hypothetical protein [Paludibacter sp.]
MSVKRNRYWNKKTSKKFFYNLRNPLISINFALCFNHKIKQMNLLNFIEQYIDEQACIVSFKAQREQKGIVCSKCGT